MKVSELIKELEASINKHGDLDVRLMLYVHTGGVDRVLYGVDCVEASESDGFTEISANCYT